MFLLTEGGHLALEGLVDLEQHGLVVLAPRLGRREVHRRVRQEQGPRDSCHSQKDYCKDTCLESHCCVGSQRSTGFGFATAILLLSRGNEDHLSRLDFWPLFVSQADVFHEGFIAPVFLQGALAQSFPRVSNSAG